jgi:hypothetical protein
MTSKSNSIPNPFQELHSELSEIKTLLRDIKEKKPEPLGENSATKTFKYLPIQDIFKARLMSRPTFYKYLKNGTFTLFKFGNKSYVDKVQFEQSFQGISLNKKAVQ